jgi:HTH-type transcriptional regulator/antitoxin HipB
MEFETLQVPITSSEQFGKLIRESRRALGLTQPAVASACGTGVRFIVDLEHGKPTVELEKALRVARMLGVIIAAINAPTAMKKIRHEL